jgi:hypothetical protein
MAAKKTKKGKKKPRDVDIKIKVNNLDKAVKAGMKDGKREKWKCGSGCGGCWVFGSALAMILSYAQNSSIFWAILHGIISWFYVIYRIIMLYV